MLFTIEHKYCGQIKIIFGYSFADACRRNNINPVLWDIMFTEFVCD